MKQADVQKKVALVTGASSGIGLDTAIQLVKNGFTVYGAARRIECMRALEENGGKALYLDLTDEKSIEKCVSSIYQETGRIDLLVNNAGFGLGGALEDVPISEARKQFEVNVFALVKLTQCVLPYMRNARSGRIINVASIAGRFSTPFMGWYHATKYALEAISDSLRLEVHEFGIDVAIIEPGIIKTPWGRIAANNMRIYSAKTSYAQNSEIIADYYEKQYKPTSNASSPSIVAKAIVKASLASHPKIRYTVGKNAGAFVFLKRILSDKMYDRTLRLFFGCK